MNLGGMFVLTKSLSFVVGPQLQYMSPAGMPPPPHPHHLHAHPHPHPPNTAPSPAQSYQPSPHPQQMPPPPHPSNPPPSAHTTAYPIMCLPAQPNQPTHGMMNPPFLSAHHHPPQDMGQQQQGHIQVIVPHNQ